MEQRLNRNAPRASRSDTPMVTLGLITLILLGLISFTLVRPAAAQQVFVTQWAAIYYQDAADLREMERRLSFTQVDNFYQSYFYTPDPVQSALSPGLAARVDGLLTKVCLLLSRWPSKHRRLRIFLLKDSGEVQQRQLVLQPFQQPCSPSFFGYGRMEGFYEPRSNSIFVSLSDFRVGILAHEMAHAILCESSAVPPPHEFQEDWAQYVEDNLN